MSRRLVGAILLVVAAVTAVVGTFLPLVWEGSAFGDGDLLVGFTTTSWETTTEAEQFDVDALLGRSPQFGVPIVIAAVVLAVAAALVLLPEHQRLAARYAAVGGTGLLAGAVWAVAAFVVSAVSAEDESTLNSYREDVREGIWVLAAAVVIAVVGVVLLHGRRVVPTGGPVVHRLDDHVGGDDTDTPPFGIPAVTVARLPESERRPD